MCTGDTNIQVSNLAFLRAIKPLRILKMSRLLKLFRLVREFSEKYRIRPAHRKILNLLLTLGAAMHIFACIFWRVKKETNSDEEMEAFLNDKGIGEGVENAYIACLYFVCTVFTTVGFGDISATNRGERVFCIVMMCLAACLFGIILSELQQIFAVSNSRSRELDDHTESVMSILKENSVPAHVENKIMSWMRFQFCGMLAECKSRDMIDRLPIALRELLAGTYFFTGLFSKVSLLAWVPDDVDSGFLRRKFVAQLMTKMTTTFYLANTEVASRRDSADRIMIVCSGSVGVFMPKEIRPLKILFGRDAFGETAVLGDPRWAGLWGIQADFVAMSDCKIVSLSVNDIQDLLKDAPAFAGVKHVFDYLAGGREKVPYSFYDEETNKKRLITFRWIWAARSLLEQQRREPELSSVASLYSAKNLIRSATLSSARVLSTVRSKVKSTASGLGGGSGSWMAGGGSARAVVIAGAGEEPN